MFEAEPTKSLVPVGEGVSLPHQRHAFNPLQRDESPDNISGTLVEEDYSGLYLAEVTYLRYRYDGDCVTIYSVNSIEGRTDFGPFVLMREWQRL